VSHGTLTVDSNGDTFSQDVAIRAHKGWNLAKSVELEIVGGSSGASDGLLDVQFKTIGLCNQLDGLRTSVVLCEN